MNAELSAISPMAAYVASFLETAWPAWSMILLAIGIHWFMLLLPPLALIGYLDRKLGADIQMRIGPSRVSVFGVFQVVADTLKLLFKENADPETQESWLFRWGMVASIVCVFIGIGSIPLAESWAIANLDSGAVTVMCTLIASSLCIFWTAYSARSQWSVLSAFRTLSLVATYVVPMAITLVSPVLLAGSPNLESIVRAQGGAPWKWFMFHDPGTILSAAAMFLALQIWQGRTPFDHARSLGELSGGLTTEYSGTRLGLLKFLEYASLFLACAFFVTVYMGGWQTPFNLESFGRAANIVEWLALMAKILFLVFLSIWIRWSLPGLRLDQIIGLSWRILVPTGLVGSAATAIWMVVFNAKGFGDLL